MLFRWLSSSAPFDMMANLSSLVVLLGVTSPILASEPTLVPRPRQAVWTKGCHVVRTNDVAAIDVRYVRDAALDEEAYRLTVAEDGVEIAASGEVGRFRALTTLRQLAIPEIVHEEKDGLLLKRCVSLSIPCGTVEDAPAYRWRGLMLDESRHFFGKEVVKHVLDLMADHKLNVFHWHLTDDQGWRIESKRHPELVAYGSVRPASPVFGRTGLRCINDLELNGEKYGPYYYTAEDIREICRYAKARHITVVPEIEIPGHVRALLAAHPEFSCRGDLSRVPRMENAVEKDVLCVGNDAAIRFLEDVFDEVAEMFDGAYFHIGGDECSKDRWRACAKCQAKLRQIGQKDEEALQGWVTRHFVEHLAKRGRRVVGWDEVLAGSPDKSVAVQVWRDPKSVQAAAEAGHDVIASPWYETYFSRQQGLADDPFTYLGSPATLPLDKAYRFNPVAGVDDPAKSRVIGAECCLWSECVWNRFDLDFKLWPRGCAFAEAVWTAPEKRDYAEFRQRMQTHRRRLIARHVNCAPLE